MVIDINDINLIIMKRKIQFLLVAIFCMFSFEAVQAQKRQFALKTNLLYWGTTTPNLGMEFSSGRKSTLQLFYGWNPWKSSSERKLRHWVLQPEYRHWFCQPFNGWFVGFHLMGGEFNVGEVKLPFGMFKELRRRRYEGWFAGGGVTGGYQWILSRHWNLEASLGLGYDYIKYDKFACGYCGEKLKSSHRNYFGPTKVAISFVYLF